MPHLATMTDPFVRSMAMPAGRVARVAAGLGRLANRHSAGGTATAAFSLVPLAAGSFDVCVLGPVLGAPLGGEVARASIGAA